MEKTWQESENFVIDGANATAVRDELIVTIWKRIADGRTLLPEFFLARMMAYLATRKVCDG